MTTDLTLMQAAIQKMHWNEARQKVLSKNIANADTPNFQPMDIKPLDFKELLKSSASSLPKSGGVGNVSLATTDPQHISLSGTSGSSGVPAAKKEKDPYETSPAGNAVILEEQLLKMNQNYTDHHLTTIIYQKSVDMLKDSIK